MRTFFTAILLGTAPVLDAQEIKLPLWMLQAFGRDEGVSDPAFNAKFYAALGLDSLRANHFIGSYTGVVEMKGENLKLAFSGWADTARVSVTMDMSKDGHAVSLAYLADLRANMAILAANNEKERAATLNDLRDLLTMNGMLHSRVTDDLVRKEGKGSRKILGFPCKQKTFIDGRDTTQAWVSTIARSPFVDAWNWLPMSSGPFMLFGMLGAFGEPMPLEVSNEELTIRITGVKVGPQPQPAFDLSSYTIDDKREGTSAVPITHSPPKDFPAPSRNTDGRNGGETSEGMDYGEVSEPPPPMQEEIQEMDAGPISQEGDYTEVPPAVEEEAVYGIASVEEQPQFPGGQEAMFRYIVKEMKYPAEAADAGIQGKVYVQFVVDPEGRVTDATVLRGVHSALDKEAVRVVKGMPKWTPGKSRGRAVPVRYNLPISFKLE